MKSKTLWWAVRIVGVLVLAAGMATLAQSPVPAHLSGIINDYTPSSVMPTGPWEIRGQWSFTLNKDSNTGNFSAALAMVRSDYWVLANLEDPTNPSLRIAHTHHITMNNATVTPIPNGFQLSGTATITKDGSPAPFSPSTLQVDITGGTSVEFSNITLTFTGGATGHFGTQAIHGVVGKAK